MVATIYSVCTSPGYTWAGMDNDCFNFVWAATTLGTPHLPGYPIKTMLDIVTFRVPIGMEGWRLAWFGSTIPAIISCILVFLIVRKLTDNKWSPYVASVSLAGAGAFFMQAIIPEVYTFSIMCMLVTYLAFVSKKEKTMAVWAGITATTSPFVFPAVFFMVFFGVRKRWWWIPVVTATALYSYCFLRNGAFAPAVPYLLNQMWFKYIGAMPLSQFWYRLRDAGILICVGFGLALIPAFMFLADLKKNWMFWLFSILSIIWFLTTDTEASYVHFLLIFPWIAIAAGLGLDKIKLKPILIFGLSFVLLLMMPWFYDIGNTMDPNLSAQTFYDDLKNVPDGSIITNVIYIGNGDIGIDERSGVTTAVVNTKEGKHLIALNELAYLSLDQEGENYRKSLRDQYNIITPVVAVLLFKTTTDYFPTGVSAPLFSITQMIAEANPNRKVYYSFIPESSPVERVLTETKLK